MKFVLKVLILAFVALMALTGAVEAADMVGNVGGANFALMHQSGQIIYNDTIDGYSSSVLTYVDGAPLNAPFVGSTATQVQWGTGTNKTNSDVLVTYGKNTTSILKGTVVLKSPHTLTWQVTIPANEQMVPYEGGFRITGTDSNSMAEINSPMNGGMPAGIQIPAPIACDANGDNIPITYSTDSNNVISINWNETYKSVFNQTLTTQMAVPGPMGTTIPQYSTVPIVYPVTIDPTLYLSPYISYMVYLNHFNATAELTAADAGGSMSNSGVSVSTTTKYTGAGSAYFSGSSYLSSTNSALYNMGTGNFVIHLVFYSTSSAANQGLLTTANVNTTSTGFSVLTGSSTIGLIDWGNTANCNLMPGTTYSLSTWTTIDFQRNGGTITEYQNGVQVAQTTTMGSSNFPLTQPTPSIWALGTLTPGSPSNHPYAGYLDEVAIWKGTTIPENQLYPDTYGEIMAGMVPSVASFTTSYTPGGSSIAVNFTDTSTNSPNNWNYYYTAYVKGVYSTGPILFSTSQNPVNTFNASGADTEYSIYMITQNTPLPQSQSPSIWVNTTGIVPSFGTNETNPNLIGGVLPIQFVDTSTGEDGLSTFSWNFGDTGTSTSQNPIHTYTSAQVFSVALTVNDGYGGYIKGTQNVTVLIGAPWPSFSVYPISGSPGLLVTFTDTSSRGTSSGLNYTWNFGDASGTQPISYVVGNTTHVYAYAGTFTPTLTIANANGTFTYTGSLITISVNQQTQTTFYSPNQIAIQFLDSNNVPIAKTAVSVNALESTLPGGLSGALLTLENAYGVPQATAAVMLSNVTQYQGTTDSDGYIVVLMISTVKYNINWTDSTGAKLTYTTYPPSNCWLQLQSTNAVTQSMYKAAATANTNLGNSILVVNMSENAAQTVATLQDFYYDASGTSSALNCWFTAPNGTTYWQNKTFLLGAGLQTCSLAVNTTPYTTWTWGFF